MAVFSYDNPNVTLQHEHYIQGAAAAGDAHRFRVFQAVRLLNLRLYISTDGTTAGGNGAFYRPQIGTSTAFVGTMAYGTQPPGFSAVLALNTDLSGGEIFRLTKGTAADAVVDFILSYRVRSTEGD